MHPTASDAPAARKLLSSARFMCSAAEFSGCPPDLGAEVAFAGRSNAGKSTALNALAGQRALARTSKTPGRTQLLNFFGCGPDEGATQRLVDLPGYGFAKAPQAQRRRWGTLVDSYVRGRDTLRLLVLLTDVRRPLMPQDVQLLEWAADAGVFVHVVLTKADKLGRSAGMQALLQTRERLQEMADGSAPAMSAPAMSAPAKSAPANGASLLSAPKGTGVDELRAVVATSLALEA